MSERERVPGSWLDVDRRHVWHPYASATSPLPVYPVVSANGVRLRLEDGRELIDGMASWWAAIHGYNHPVLNRALEDQLHRMAHVMFGGLTHPSAVELARLLVDITPESLTRVFFADSGSVSVEVAIKMATQYWMGRGEPKKRRLLTVRGGYHGDTFGAMSVTDPDNGMHHLFSHMLPKQLFAEAPGCRTDEEWRDDDIEGFQSMMETHRDEIAAVILEPIVQGAGGMRFYAPEYLRRARRLCTDHRVLLILDEIATGFGRTGTLFACEQASVAPDILCLGKALTGGYMTLAATLCTEDVAAHVCRAEGGVFMHGPTFMANPLACAVARASVNLLLTTPYQERVAAIEGHFQRSLSTCADLPHVREVRVKGAIGVVEMERPVDMTWIEEQFVARGVWVRPFGKLVYLMPPYIIEPEDIDALTSAVVEVIQEIPH